MEEAMAELKKRKTAAEAEKAEARRPHHAETI